MNAPSVLSTNLGVHRRAARVERIHDPVPGFVHAGNAVRETPANAKLT